MRILSVQRLSEFNTPAFYSENAYLSVRIPGLVSLPSGALVCVYECRRGGDWSAIDIGMQRSENGGKTWSPTQIVVSGKGKNTMNNPVLISDGDTLHLFYCENYKRLFHTQSKDHGQSFLPPVELTDQIERLTQDLFWSVLAVGPGHAVALKDGTLLLPVWFGQNRKDIFAHHPSVVAVLRGLNGGKEWRLSAPIGQGILSDPSECCISELADRRILLNIRNENAERLRAVSFSSDGGENWSPPVLDQRLKDPVCCAGMCRCGGDLLFTNCDHNRLRKNLCLKRFAPDLTLSETLPVSAAGGYSDVCYSPALNRAFVAFENETNGLKIAEMEM